MPATQRSIAKREQTSDEWLISHTKETRGNFLALSLRVLLRSSTRARKRSQTVMMLPRRKPRRAPRKLSWDPSRTRPHALVPMLYNIACTYPIRVPHVNESLSPRRRVGDRLLEHAPSAPFHFPRARRRGRGRPVRAIIHFIRRDTLYKRANRRVERLEVIDLCINQSMSRVDGVEVTIEMRRDHLIYTPSLTLPSF